MINNIDRAKIIKAGANVYGLKLIGDHFIGLRFVPCGDLADAADSLLEPLAEESEIITNWLHEARDGEYDRELWRGEISKENK
jgi:hypothetical protein